ncbi:unnamed protein product [Cuscuta epithymum]|uniref:Sulfotransferase n=1 Tax=Cuscuta epithymum TaxID=186058 RepID=A0AAV0GA19_9ASTE|nr:unnamed protein product [Cuscuta epithymum]
MLFAVVCGVYIISICMRQTTNLRSIGSLSIPLIDPKCSIPSSNVQKWEIPLQHFPKPQTFSRGECECNPVRFFAILSMQRSGSGWFETLLNSHINVSSNGEIFNVRQRRANVSMVIKTLDKVYNLDFLTSSSKNECSAAVGFKWMLNQAHILAKYKPSVNISALIPKLRSTMKNSAMALDFFKNTRHVVFYYEDIVRNRTKLRDVQEFLGLPIRNLTSLQVKIHSGSLSNQIKNWDEVQEKLKGTVYEKFLYTDED